MVGLVDPDTKLRGVQACVLTLPEPDLDGSATLVAVTVTVSPEVTVEGAVYSPLLDSVPSEGFLLQTTEVFALPVTVAENCCCWEGDTLTVAGLTDTDTGGGLPTTVQVPFWTHPEFRPELFPA